MCLDIIAGLILIALIVIGAVYGYISEKLEWNNGKCKRCGQAWECYDMDSQGGRLYKDSSGHLCSITWNVDK